MPSSSQSPARLEPVERARRCRAMAAENDALARLADDPKIEAGYFELARQWTLLAEELEGRNDTA